MAFKVSCMKLVIDIPVKSSPDREIKLFESSPSYVDLEKVVDSPLSYCASAWTPSVSEKYAWVLLSKERKLRTYTNSYFRSAMAQWQRGSDIQINFP